MREKISERFALFFLRFQSCKAITYVCVNVSKDFMIDHNNDKEITQK